MIDTVALLFGGASGVLVRGMLTGLARRAGIQNPDVRSFGADAGVILGGFLLGKTVVAAGIGDGMLAAGGAALTADLMAKYGVRQDLGIGGGSSVAGLRGGAVGDETLLTPETAQQSGVSF